MAFWEPDTINLDGISGDANIHAEMEGTRAEHHRDSQSEAQGNPLPDG
jgi:hypothetical protein